MPKCSIIIPCYNQTDYLFDCLNSVLEQTFQDWEAIVVDDASTSGDIKSIISTINDRRIFLVQQGFNRGLAAARNTGIRIAQGEYLLPLDADDRLMPDFLDHMLNILVKNPESSCAFPDFHYFGTIEGNFEYSLHDGIELLNKQWLPGPGILMHKALWENIGGYCEDEIFRYGNEDWDFYLSAQEIGFVPIHVPETLYCYRQSQNSLSTRLVFFDYLTRELMYKRHCKLFDKYKKRDEFLANGYIHSAKAYLGISNNAKAFSLSVKALIFRNNRTAAIKLVLKSMVPRKIRKTIRKLISYFSRTRRNLLQNIYLSLGRHKIIQKWFWEINAKGIDIRYGKLHSDYPVLKKILTQNKITKIFDFGCGSGRLFPLYLSCSIKEIVGQDISKTALKLAKKRYGQANLIIHLIDRSILDLEYPFHYFDLAISNRVLQYVPINQIDNVIRKLTLIASMVYVNEFLIGDLQGFDTLILQHDYKKLFLNYDYFILDEGSLIDESGKPQKWVLYGKSSN